MTLPALLSKLSRRVPRYVTLSGQVISDEGVLAVEGEHLHPEYGLVTPVRPHTNHGGALPTEVDQQPWWKTDPDLLNAERVAVANRFPAFEYVEVEGRPGWRGQLDSGQGVFWVTILHRPDRGLPRVVPDRPHRFRRRAGRRLQPSPHLYVNGDLCIAEESDWDPDQHDVTSVIAWTAHWLAAFTEWWITGEWPCEGTTIDAP